MRGRTQALSARRRDWVVHLEEAVARRQVVVKQRWAW